MTIFKTIYVLYLISPFGWNQAGVFDSFGDCVAAGHTIQAQINLSGGPLVGQTRPHYQSFQITIPR